MTKPVSEIEEWGTLHDLALLYLAFMHGSRAIKAPFTTQSVVRKMQYWQPQYDADTLRALLSNVLMVYVSLWGEKMLEVAVASLRRDLPEQQRAEILLDIASMVCEGGLYYPDDADFIERIAQAWAVERHLMTQGAVAP
jgi:hypothetical protein